MEPKYTQISKQWDITYSYYVLYKMWIVHKYIFANYYEYIRNKLVDV